MQYAQGPYTEWAAPNNYDQFYSNGVTHHRHHHLSSNASSLTDGSSAFGSWTSYLYDILPSGTGRISPELPVNYEVLMKKDTNIEWTFVPCLGLLCEKEET